MFNAGKPEYGLTLLKLGEAYRTQQLQDKAGADFVNALGGMVGGEQGSTAAPAPRPQAFDPASVPFFVASAGQEHGISPEFMTKTAWIQSRGNPMRATRAAHRACSSSCEPLSNMALLTPLTPRRAQALRPGSHLTTSARSCLRLAANQAMRNSTWRISKARVARLALLRNPNASAHSVLTNVYGDAGKGRRGHSAERRQPRHDGRPICRAVDGQVRCTQPC